MAPPALATEGRSARNRRQLQPRSDQIADVVAVPFRAASAPDVDLEDEGGDGVLVRDCSPYSVQFCDAGRALETQRNARLTLAAAVPPAELDVDVVVVVDAATSTAE